MWQAWRVCCFGAVVVGVLAAGSTDIYGQKKKDKKAAPKDPEYPATPAEYAQIKNRKEMKGTLVAMDAINHTLTLRIEIPHLEPNEKYKPPQAPKAGPGVDVNSVAYQTAKFQFDQWRLYQDLQKKQQQAMNAKNPQDRQRALAAVQMDLYKFQVQQMAFMAKMNTAAYKNGQKAMDPNNQPFKVVNAKKDYSLPVQDDVIVRKLFLGLEYDDTGNIKQYSDKEKAELRGSDKSKPGYTAKLEEVLVGQEVDLFLTPPPKSASTKKDKDAKPEDEPVGDMPDRPSVHMIVMTRDMMSSNVEGAPANNNNKKNKK